VSKQAVLFLLLPLPPLPALAGDVVHWRHVTFGVIDCDDVTHRVDGPLW
jgi:hypothetical protein